MRKLHYEKYHKVEISKGVDTGDYMREDRVFFLILKAPPGSTVKKYFLTAQLLLHEEGIEVAARPHMYPLACFADSDLRRRLVGPWLKEGQLPDMRKAFLRKAPLL